MWVIPDKYKGTLTAAQAARALAKGWRMGRPQDEVNVLPMSDGGDGFGNVLGSQLGARRIFVATTDAAGRPRQATWWWEAHSRTAVVETAQVIGLALLPPGEFHPFRLDTGGLGRVLASVARHRPRRCFIGVGGSATNDGGFGLARALGWKVLDRSDREIQGWRQLARAHSVRPPTDRLRLGRVVVALDVQNLLLGSEGCTRVYGPQKGLSRRDFPPAEQALAQWARILAPDLAQVPGSGAAGGLGFGLMALLRARPESGFAIFARLTHLARRLRGAKLVLTGEGALDSQSLMGKGVGMLARWCRDAGVPCVALPGVDRTAGHEARMLAGIFPMAPEFVTFVEARTHPAHHLTCLARQVARAHGEAFQPARRGETE